MKLRLLLIFTLFTCLTQAQVIWTNPITGTDPGTTAGFYTTGQTVAPNITVSGIRKGPGLTGNAGDDRYNANGWATSNTTLVLTNEDYFEFTITPNAGYQIDFESFTYTGKASNTGPKLFALRSSLNYATAIGTANELGTTISLSAAAYQDIVTPITFRFYGWNASAAGGTFSINDFTFNANVSTICSSVAITSVTPASGPIGTEVTVNAASGLAGATATFEGIAATVISSSNTQLIIRIPTGAATGNLIVTNAAACPSNPIAYTIIKDDKSGCGSGTLSSDLFISEIADASVGSLSYIEITNNTGVAKNLNNYKIKFAQNANAYTSTLHPIGTTMLAHGATLVVTMDNSSSTTYCSTVGGDGSYGSISIIGAGLGLNFNSGGCDTVGLFYTPTSTTNPIDVFGQQGNASWMVPSDTSPNGNGADYRRKYTAVAPKNTFTLSDWDYVDFSVCADDNYSDIGKYDGFKIVPVLNSRTTPSIVCTTKSLEIEVAATEGIVGAPGLAYQWYYAIPGAASYVIVPAAGVYSGTTSAKLVISSIEGLDNYQYYCQIRENTATCYTASNAYVIKEIPSTLWNGTWTPSAPTNTMKAVIGANYNTTTSGSIDACKCQINSGVTVTVTDAHYLDVVMGINNGGTIIRASGGSIGQSNDTGVNTGAGINTINRTTSSYDRFDSTYFSSPVSNTTIGLPFAGWRINDSYAFNPANWSDLNNDNFDDNGDAWVRLTAATPMIPGVGYAVMAPTTGTFPTTANVQFTGNLNNGEVKVPLSLSGNAADANDDYNFVGNPYPSKLDVVKFIDANILPANNRISGTIYLWTHKTPIAATVGPYQYNFSVADYAMRNKFAGTASGSGSPAPTQYLATEQGFFVEAVTAGDLIFNNSMRVHETTDHFYKSQAGPEAMSRIWLNMESSLGFMSQLAVGYADDSSLDVDPGYDGLMFPAGNVLSFYSTIGANAYKIQARGNYSADDVIPLGYTYNATISGTFDIKMDGADGLFDANQASPVFLEDLHLHIIHDLRQGAYSFSTAPGTFDNRFVLRFTNTALGNTNFDALQKQVVVAQKGQKVSIRSAVQPLEEIVVYDLLGRTIYTSEKLNQNEFSTSDIAKAQQGLIVKIRLQDGSTVTKKIFF